VAREEWPPASKRELMESFSSRGCLGGGIKRGEIRGFTVRFYNQLQDEVNGQFFWTDCPKGGESVEGKDIRRVRQSLGMSQEKLARELGLSAKTVYRYENELVRAPKSLQFQLEHIRA
jgi:DNA-binding XRE family transcriptional regulator